MKNYTINNELAKNFILNYTIKNNQIIVNLASKEKIFIPYTSNNEQQVQKLMEDQIIDFKDFPEFLNVKNANSTLLALMFISLSFLSGIILLSGPANAFLLKSLIVICSIVSVKNCYNIIKGNLMLKDFYKNELLIQNKKKLNESIKVSKNILSNTTSKTKEVVQSISQDKPVFTINSIDQMKYDDLIQILENIDREESFDFDYANDPNKTLRLRKYKF